MPTLNFMKNGTIRQVPLMTSAKNASPTGVPCFCAYLNGTVYYALTSSLSTNAVAAFRYSGKTYYLVTKHESSEISAWTLIYSRTTASADTYELPEEYAGMPIKIECAGASGSSSNISEYCWAQHSNNYTYTYSGKGGSGGKGGSATTYVGECDAGTVFTITLAEGSTVSTGSSGSTAYPNDIVASHDPGSGCSGGSGGTGFSVSVTNAAGETKTCTAYGGGGGGGAGGFGMAVVSAYWVVVGMNYTWSAGNAGKGGTGGSSGSVSGSSGVSAGGGGNIGPIFNPGGQTKYFNSDYYYGTGGTGGSSGSSTSAYCRIYVGSLR